MPDASNIADIYIATWNERDPVKRSELLSEAWAEGARYIDPLMAGEGTEEIGQLIAGVQDRFPDFRFSLDGMADSVGSLVRFSWDLDPVIDAPIVKGTDFVTIQDGRISSVVGFIDMAPALG